MNKMRSYDVFGNIALVKFPRQISSNEKRKFAQKILESNKSVKTILEKSGKFKGRLRKMQTKHLLGEKTKEVLYRENGCVFRFNLDNVYFSTRLSNERKEVSSHIKKPDKVLVMFAGAAPFSVVIAKTSGAKVFSNEINREANTYGRLNAELNKVKDKIVFLDGDIKKIALQLSHHPPQRININTKKSKLKNQLLGIPAKFEVIVMPRPQLKDSFLKEAFSLSKKGTRIFYYDFCKVEDIDLVVGKIKSDAKKYKKKIKLLKVKTAGEIAPYKVRVRVDFVVV